MAPIPFTDYAPVSKSEQLQLQVLNERIPACFAHAQNSLQATIIDFTLSRATLAGTGIVSGGLEDEGIFEGSGKTQRGHCHVQAAANAHAGDNQFDCYRTMRIILDEEWSKYRPCTNIVWLHYLVQKLLHEKKLKVPPSREIASPAKAARVAGRRGGTVAKAASLPVSVAERHCYEALLAAEEILGMAVQAAVSAATKRRQKQMNTKSDPRRRSRRSSDEASEDQDLLFRRSGDFVEWWVSGE